MNIFLLLLLLLSLSLSHALFEPNRLRPKQRPVAADHANFPLSLSVLAKLSSRHKKSQTVKKETSIASLKRTRTVSLPKQPPPVHPPTSNRLSTIHQSASTPTASPVANSGNGFNGLSGDVCNFDYNCAGFRFCSCIEGGAACFCVPFAGYLVCVSSTACPFGEVCLVSPSGLSRCLSEGVKIQFGWKERGVTTPPTVAPTPSPVANSGNGVNALTGDVCTFDRNCAGTRLCDCRADRNRCFCIPEDGYLDCSSSVDCPVGELCLCFPEYEDFACLSEGIQIQFGWEERGVSNICPPAPTRTSTPVPTPTRTRTPAPMPTRTRTPAPTTPTTTSPTTTSPTTTPPTGSGVRLTGDRCDSGSDCADILVCRCEPSPCVCFPAGGKSVRCKDTEDCPTGEICVEKLPLDGGAQACTSKSYAKSNDLKEIPATTTEDVCVALYHLEDHGVELEDKVFDRDYRAWVLCDRWGSCATPGHMVMWEGQGMMMKSYCSVVGCDRKSMLVNSMRYKRKGRIGSRSQGLEFSVFAAKWATRTEETVLNGLIRMGL